MRLEASEVAMSRLSPVHKIRTGQRSGELGTLLFVSFVGGGGEDFLACTRNMMRTCAEISRRKYIFARFNVFVLGRSGGSRRRGGILPLHTNYYRNRTREIVA